MSPRWFLFAFSSLCLSVFAHTAPPPLLQEVEVKYFKAKTLRASFVQTTESAMTRKKTDSQGTIVVKHPGRIRWETTAPEKNLLVSNGKKAWFYRAPFSKDDQGQLIERSADEVQSDFAKKLLLGSFKFKKETVVEAQGEGVYRITPAHGSAGNVKSALLRIDPKKKLIEGVKLEYEDGNSADIRLSQIELGKKIEDQSFEFIPPPGTVRVQD